jgi:hypothetical protein
MWEFILRLIYGVVRIWYVDSQIRDHDPLTSGSEFDRQARLFVARICGGVILLLLVAGCVWWFVVRS